MEQRIHLIGFVSCAAVAATGLITLIAPHLGFSQPKSASIQNKAIEQTVLRTVKSWNVVQVGPSPDGRLLAQLSQKLKSYGKKYGSLENLVQFQVLDDGTARVEPSMDHPTIGTRLKGGIMAQLVGDFTHGREIFTFGLKPVKLGLEVVSVSHTYGEAKPKAGRSVVAVVN